MPAQSSRGRHAAGRGGRVGEGEGGGGGRHCTGNGRVSFEGPDQLKRNDGRQGPRGGGGAAAAGRSARGGAGITGGGRVGNPTRRLFESTFPAPLGPPPRRIPPSLHSDPLHVPLLQSHGSASSGLGQIANGVVYRTADSTQRALNELAQKRQEKTERRRAATLLAALLFLATVVHFAGTKGSWTPGRSGSKEGWKGKALRASGDRDGNAEGVIISLKGFEGNGEGNNKTNVGRGDQWGGSGMKATNDAPNTEEEKEEEQVPEPEEPFIPPGKEFLEPIKYFSDARSTPRKSDTPFFFHIPRSGGQTVKDIVGQCLGKVLASEVGVRDGHGTDPTLNVVEIKSNRYVNVDTTSVEGIQRAASLGLAESKLADLIASSYLQEAGTLFDLYHQGRAFLIMRNPVERAVSMYYHRTRGDNADLDSSLTLEDFAQGNGIENNWMTRFLIGAMEGELTKKDLERAKEVLEKKFLIGFLDDGDETMARVMRYFGWEFDADETKKMKQEDCMKDLLKDGTNINPEGYEMPKKGTQAFALIMWQTQFDLKLYDYARELFNQQTKFWGTKERKKELKKKKKGGK